MISTGAVHHLTLTVRDLRSSIEFYTTLLGFQVAAELSDYLKIISLFPGTNRIVPGRASIMFFDH
jgi:catechol 2,3-dioxygenase-like lactoylglutathione lyase family enzyme